MFSRGVPSSVIISIRNLLFFISNERFEGKASFDDVRLGQIDSPAGGILNPRMGILPIGLPLHKKT
jgi:hypothetical protein